MLGDSLRFLKEQTTVEVMFYREQPISVELPTFVELAVADTPPSVKGNTAAGATKPAVLETGVSVNIPYFVNNGDVVRVDTRTGSYLERVM
jgi:elongation factor P